MNANKTKFQVGDKVRLIPGYSENNDYLINASPANNQYVVVVPDNCGLVNVRTARRYESILTSIFNFAEDRLEKID